MCFFFFSLFSSSLHYWYTIRENVNLAEMLPTLCLFEGGRRRPRRAVHLQLHLLPALELEL